MTEARDRLGLTDRALTVLNALLTFHPDDELRADGPLVVYPSNAQLALRTHGMAGTTLRRHIAVLVGAGVVIRRDSPNGKRYARRRGRGDCRGVRLRSHAAGSAAEEIAGRAEACRAERQRIALGRERPHDSPARHREDHYARYGGGHSSRLDALQLAFAPLNKRLPRGVGEVEIAALVSELSLLAEDSGQPSGKSHR